jgi:hypothetical protein
MSAPPTTPPVARAGTSGPTPPAPTHACVRCGAPVPVDVGLCERCNPLGLRDSSASQVHGIAIGGVVLAVVLLAVFARISVSGIGPFAASASAVAEGNGLAVTLAVTNKGTSVGQTTCRVIDPADRTGSGGAIILSPRIDPNQTRTFTVHVTELGTVAVPLDVACTGP